MKWLKWTLVLLMAAGAVYAKSELEKKHDYFSKWDADGDGQLSQEEYTLMVKSQFEKQGQTGYETEAVKRFNRNDKNGDGFISWEEHVEKLVEIGQLPPDVLNVNPDLEKKRDYFSKWDANGDNKLSQAEYALMVKSQFEKQGMEGYETEAVKRFYHNDRDGDDVVSWEEYVETLVDIGQLPPDVLNTNAAVASAAEDASSETVGTAPQESPSKSQMVQNKWDTDKDGRISREEFKDMTRIQFEKNGKEGYEKAAESRFAKKDLDGDGMLTLEEFSAQGGK